MLQITSLIISYAGLGRLDFGALEREEYFIDLFSELI